jgi:hypothetical protein
VLVAQGAMVDVSAWTAKLWHKAGVVLVVCCAIAFLCVTLSCHLAGTPVCGRRLLDLLLLQTSAHAVRHLTWLQGTQLQLC